MEDQKTNSNQPEPHDSAHAGHVESGLPRLRTFADDLSEEIKKKGTTTASIVQAERERAAREIALDQDVGATVAKYKNPALLVGTMLLIGVGAAVLLGAYFYSALVMPENVSQTPSIIFPNKVVSLTVPPYQEVPDTLALERFAVNLPLGEIERIDLTLEGATTTVRTLLETLGAPATLLREAQSVMFGVHSFERNQPFIIIEVTQYDRAFGAMLTWEEEMGRSFGNFFKPVGGTVPPTLAFTDRVIQNIDVRVSQNEWPILYAFPRRDVVVITTNQYTLQEVLTRLSAQNNSSVVP